MKKKFEFLEHTADTYVAAYGRDLMEAFENSALATFEVITDTETVALRIWEEVEVEGNDEQSLLYNWIEELLVRFEIENRLYSRFEIEDIQNIGGKIKLKARIAGEPFDPKKHKQKIGIKGITYYRMKIKKKDERTTIEFILDT